MKKRILILSHDNKIGDAIVATGLFRPLRQLWHDCEIGVLCGVSNAAIYRFHPDVKWLHIAKSRNIFVRIWASLQARLKRYDMVVHFGLDLANRSEQIVLSVVNAKQRYLFAPHPVGPRPNDVVILGDWLESHYSDRHLAFLRTLGSNLNQYKYEIRLGLQMKRYIAEEKLRIVINSRGSMPNRSLSTDWVKNFVNEWISQTPNSVFQLLSASHDHAEELADRFADLSHCVNVTPWNNSVVNALAEINHGQILISPDTYAVHAASAWNTPVIALHDPDSKTEKLWAPLSESFIQITARKGKVVEDIPVDEVIKALAHLLSHPQSRQHIFLD